MKESPGEEKSGAFPLSRVRAEDGDETAETTVLRR